MKALNEFSTVTEARSYEATRQQMLHKDRLVHFLTKHRCVSTLQNSDDELAKGFYLAVSAGIDEYNVMRDHPLGVDNIDLLNHLVSIGAVNQGFADDCLAYANQTYQPYEAVTLHEFQVAKGDVDLVLVQAQSGWVTINTTLDCEAHNPRLLAESPRTGELKRVNSFPQVGAAGAYECQVPAQWRTATLYVDNSYGVIS